MERSLLVFFFLFFLSQSVSKQELLSGTDDFAGSCCCRSGDFLPGLTDEAKPLIVNGGSSDGGEEGSISWTHI